MRVLTSETLNCLLGWVLNLFKITTVVLNGMYCVAFIIRSNIRKANYFEWSKGLFLMCPLICAVLRQLLAVELVVN